MYNNYDFNISSSSKTIMNALKKNNNWLLFASGHTSKQGQSKTLKKLTSSQDRITYSFRYKK